MQTIVKKGKKIKAALGSVAAVMAVLLLTGSGTYFVISNKDYFSQINSDELLNTIFDIGEIFTIVLLAICCMIILALTFVKAFKHSLQNIIRRDGKIDVGDDWFLGCISILLTIFIYIFFKKATIDDLFSSLNGTSEIVSLLVGVITLILLAVTYHIIYRLLRSCIKREGLLRTYSDEITHLLVESVCKLIKSVVQSISEVPNLYDKLWLLVKKAILSFWQLIFGDEEETI